MRLRKAPVAGSRKALNPSQQRKHLHDFQRLKLRVGASSASLPRPNAGGSAVLVSDSQANHLRGGNARWVVNTKRWAALFAAFACALAAGAGATRPIYINNL